MAKCTKCEIKMAHKKHHKKHHKVGKQSHSRRRSRVGAISKEGLMETAEMGAAALGTAVALSYVTPSLVSSLSTVFPATPATTAGGSSTPNTMLPWVVNAGKVAAGLALGSMAKGKSAKLLEGAAIGMIFDGGSKILSSLITGSPMVAGTISQPLRVSRNTIAGRMRGTISQPLRVDRATIGSAQDTMMVKKITMGTF